jgi:TatD DNase family protein
MMSIFTDTHCHIHDSAFFPDGGKAEYERALKAGIHRVVCVGTDSRSSREALVFSDNHDKAYASFGIHPHDSSVELPTFNAFSAWCLENKSEKVVAIGEIGLDYYYMHSPREQQIELFEKQIDLALRLDLPIIFHVREAFDDFWPIFSNFKGIRGVLHSYTDDITNMEEGLGKGLYIGVNGIATFAPGRDEITRAIPLEKILLETDAPYLTPKPIRGKINEPGNVGYIASYVAELRGITVEELSRATEANSTGLFF